jgi:hypothetical protein
MISRACFQDRIGLNMAGFHQIDKFFHGHGHSDLLGVRQFNKSVDQRVLQEKWGCCS